MLQFPNFSKLQNFKLFKVPNKVSMSVYIYIYMYTYMHMYTSLYIHLNQHSVGDEEVLRGNHLVLVGFCLVLIRCWVGVGFVLFDSSWCWFSFPLCWFGLGVVLFWCFMEDGIGWKV